MKRTYFMIISTVAAFALCAYIMPQRKTDTTNGDIIKAWISNAEKTYVAGNEISLECRVSDLKTEGGFYDLFLYVSHSFGSTVLSMEDTGKPSFAIPTSIANKSGQIQWKLIQNNRILDEGSFRIQPDTLSVPVVESYVGPPSVIAGGMDYTMMVILATDAMDNLLPDGNLVSFQEQFKKTNVKDDAEIFDRIAWKRIRSPETVGRISLSAGVHKESSKELVVEVRPNNAKDFELTEVRVHTYADGNQIAIYKTSQIKDEFGNVISDGTLVRFEISSSDGTRWQTSATTINGYAFGNLLHPDHASVWSVKAFIDGAAESNQLRTEYESVADNFEVSFSENNRTITVGPIRSYMNQLIPDGARVGLKVGSATEIIYKTTSDGLVEFQLAKDFYDDGIHTITISTLGLVRIYKIELK